MTGFRVHKFRFHQQEYLLACKTEKKKLIFVMIGTHENFYWDQKKYQKDYYSYDEVFDDIPSTFTIKEASEYLEVAEITIRRWVKEGKLRYTKVGKNYVFRIDDLREIKRKI